MIVVQIVKCASLSLLYDIDFSQARTQYQEKKTTNHMSRPRIRIMSTKRRMCKKEHGFHENRVEAFQVCDDVYETIIACLWENETHGVN